MFRAELRAKFKDKLGDVGEAISEEVINEESDEVKNVIHENSDEGKDAVAALPDFKSKATRRKSYHKRKDTPLFNKNLETAIFRVEA